MGGDGQALLKTLHDDPIPRYASQREGLEDYLFAEGYIEETGTLPDAEIRIEVLGRMKEELDAAGLTREDLESFFDDIRQGPTT